MPSITREEFSKIYNERFMPTLKEIEGLRVETYKQIKPYEILSIILCALMFIFFFIPLFIVLFFITFLGFVLTLSYIIKQKSKIREKLKKEILSKIVGLYDNIYISDNKNIVSPAEIKEMGLFPLFVTKCDDDIFIGIHKGCNFAIDECYLKHDEGSGKHKKTVADFAGLLVKIQMNKNFNGKTIVGENAYIRKQPGYDEVKLEDVEFSKNMKVYSTDQIEARYLLTPSFIERLLLLGKTFIDSRNTTSYANGNKLAKCMINIIHPTQKNVSAAFIEGYIYLFIPKTENFFEINTQTSLLDENKYYDIYCQIQLILSIIDYFKLDLKLGL